jgi:hypothetical protein
VAAIDDIECGCRIGPRVLERLGDLDEGDGGQ